MVQELLKKITQWSAMISNVILVTLNIFTTNNQATKQNNCNYRVTETVLLRSEEFILWSIQGLDLDHNKFYTVDKYHRMIISTCHLCTAEYDFFQV